MLIFSVTLRETRSHPRPGIDVAWRGFQYANSVHVSTLKYELPHLSTEDFTEN